MGPYLLSQCCRNPGNFPLEVAPWAFRPQGCWEAVLSNRSHKYFPRSGAVVSNRAPNWLNLIGSEWPCCVLGPGSASLDSQLGVSGLITSLFPQPSPASLPQAPLVCSQTCVLGCHSLGESLSTERPLPSSPPSRWWCQAVQTQGGGPRLSGPHGHW